LLGICLNMPNKANAGLIVQTINQTVTSGNTFLLDVDQDGSDDLSIEVDNEDIGGINVRLRIFRVGITLANNPFASGKSQYVAKVAPGSEIGADLFNGTTGRGDIRGLLFDDNGGDWSFTGDHGFLGISVRRAAKKGEPLGARYGWVEITRGSAIIGRVGYQSTPAITAVTPSAPQAAPTPNSLVLLLGATGCLIGMYRGKTTRPRPTASR